MPYTKEDIFSLIKERIKEGKKGYTASVPTQEILDLVCGELSIQTQTFKSLLGSLDSQTRTIYNEYESWRLVEENGVPRDIRSLRPVTDDSLKNCHGRWTEALFDRIVWDALSEINRNSTGDEYFVYVKLPERRNPTNENPRKKNAKVWTSLLGKEPLDNIEIRKKSLRTQNVKLESSNPDAVVLRLKKSECKTEWDPSKPYSAIKDKAESVFSDCKGLVQVANQLIAFLSVKASTRSDRRYQFIVEGNSTKGLYAAAFDTPDCDLKIGALMRNKYYAFSLEEERKADHQVLDGLIMFASLFNEAADGHVCAIDEFNNCETPDQVAGVIKRICSHYQA